MPHARRDRRVGLLARPGRETLQGIVKEETPAAVVVVTKQAMQFCGRDPTPILLPAYPGLDGGKHGHWGSIAWSTWDDTRRDTCDQGTVQA